MCLHGRRCGDWQRSERDDDSTHRRAASSRTRPASTGVPWRKWGPYLRERQWGTVREDYSDERRCLELLQPRSGPLARLSLGRGRPGRLLRRQAAALLRARPLEREGSHSQGAALRPDQRRGQPRRGRQGVLLLPRLDADPLVHEVALQVPPGGLPLRRPGRDERQPQPHGARVRAPRYRRVRRRSLLRRVRRVRQGVARGYPRPHHRRKPRPGAGDAPRAAHPLVPQHVDLVAREWPSRPRAGRRPERLTRDRRLARRSWEIGGSTCEGASALLFTENETNTQRLFGKPNASPVRQGRHQRLRRPRTAGRRQSRAAPGRRWPPTISHGRRPGRARSSGCG